MTRHALPLVLLATLTLATGCSDGKSTAQPTAPAAAPAITDPDAQLTNDERLALAKVMGTSAVDQTLTVLQASVRKNMRRDDGLLLLGQTWVRKARESADPGFYLNAKACADIVLARTPGDRLALDLVGIVLLNQHRFEEARTLATDLLAKRDDDAVALGTLSDANLELGRYDEATAAAQKMLELKPNLPSYSRASHLLWLRGERKAAKETARVAIDAGRGAKGDHEPGAWMLVQAAMIFWHEGDFDGADAGFDKALDRVPGYAPALVGKGRVAMGNADFRRAAELFERAYRVSPLVETAWLLGDAKEAAGDAAGAAKAHADVEREGRRSDPRSLALFLATKNRSASEALKLAREEYAVRKDIVTEDALAWALHRSGDAAGAKASIARARRLGTPDARLLFHEGAIEIAGGDAAKGKKLVAAALAMNPAFDLSSVAEARALLAGEHGRVATR